jgi:hypothetical protein
MFRVWHPLVKMNTEFRRVASYTDYKFPCEVTFKENGTLFVYDKSDGNQVFIAAYPEGHWLRVERKDKEQE